MGLSLRRFNVGIYSTLVKYLFFRLLSFFFYWTLICLWSRTLNQLTLYCHIRSWTLLKFLIFNSIFHIFLNFRFLLLKIRWASYHIRANSTFNNLSLKTRCLQSKMNFLLSSISIFESHQLLLNTFKFILNSIKSRYLFFWCNNSSKLLIKKAMKMWIYTLPIHIIINNKTIIIIVVKNLQSYHPILSKARDLHLTLVVTMVYIFMIIFYPLLFLTLIIFFFDFSACTLLLDLDNTVNRFKISNLSTISDPILFRNSSKMKEMDLVLIILCLLVFCRSMFRLRVTHHCFEPYEDLSKLLYSSSFQ